MIPVATPIVAMRHCRRPDFHLRIYRENVPDRFLQSVTQGPWFIRYEMLLTIRISHVQQIRLAILDHAKAAP